MTFKELDSCIMVKQGVTYDYPFDGEVRVYRIAEKIFDLSKDVHPLEVNLKSNPIYALKLRSIYEGVRAGYHMSKKHWNTLRLEGSDVDCKTAKELIEHSCELVYESLTKKKREALES